MASTPGSLRQKRASDTAGLEVALVERALCDGGLLFSRTAPGFRCFYRLTLQPTLFGGLDLVREWGRWAPGPTTHRRLVEHYPDQAGVVRPLGDAVRVRLRHGYRARALQGRFVPSATTVLWCPRPSL